MPTEHFNSSQSHLLSQVHCVQEIEIGFEMKEWGTIPWPMRYTGL